MRERIKFEKSSGNVFADIGLDNPEEHLLRADLGIKVIELIAKMELTQVEAANRLGIKQPEVSRLKGGRYSHYSIERLLGFLNRLNQNVEIRITPAKGRRAAMSVKG